MKGVIIEIICEVIEIKEPNIKHVVSIEIMGRITNISAIVTLGLNLKNTP